MPGPGYERTFLLVLAEGAAHEELLLNQRDDQTHDGSFSDGRRVPRPNVRELARTEEILQEC